MKISIQSHVDRDYLTVKNGFDKSLFEKLSPAFPPVKLIRFDGSSKGDLVSLELNFLVFKQKWTSKIIEDKTDSKEFYFIDEGIELPFFLKSWKHKHRIIKNKGGSIIKDEIEYTAPSKLMTYMLFPVLYSQFRMRKPIYKKYFKI